MTSRREMIRSGFFSFRIIAIILSSWHITKQQLHPVMPGLRQLLLSHDVATFMRPGISSANAGIKIYSSSALSPVRFW